MASWTNVPGPQYFVNPGQVPAGYNFTRVYLYEWPYYSDPYGFIPGNLGITYNVRPNGTVCFFLNDPCNIAYSQIWLNAYELGYQNGHQIRKTIAHEFGHTLGLGHHPSLNSLMFGQDFDWHAVDPSVLDYGTNPPCNEGGVDLITVRCIYKWSW